MDKSVTIATHVGPLVTQIRDTDTVASFLEELKDTIIRTTKGNLNPSWHLLVYKSRILSPNAKLIDVVTDTDEGLVYVHPIGTAVPVGQVATKTIPVHSPSKNSPTASNISITSNSSNRSGKRSSVSIVPSNMPPASFFNAENLESLERMGFSELRAMQALLIFNHKFDPSLDWLLALENPDDSFPLSSIDQEALNEALARYAQEHVSTN